MGMRLLSVMSVGAGLMVRVEAGDATVVVPYCGADKGCGDGIGMPVRVPLMLGMGCP
jgi:hypothetical protein